MAVVKVGEVRVLVAERRMRVHVDVRFPRRVSGAVRVLMVFVMGVGVAVGQGLVFVPVVVLLGQMQPDAQAHQRCREAMCKC